MLSACKWVGSKTDIKKKQLGKRVLYLMAILGSSSSSKPLKDTVVSYVEQYACQLGWDGHVVRRACDIATKAGIHGLLDGSSPLSAAAGVLYLEREAEGDGCGRQEEEGAEDRRAAQLARERLARLRLQRDFEVHVLPHHDPVVVLDLHKCGSEISQM